MEQGDKAAKAAAKVGEEKEESPPLTSESEEESEDDSDGDGLAAFMWGRRLGVVLCMRVWRWYARLMSVWLKGFEVKRPYSGQDRRPLSD